MEHFNKVLNSQELQVQVKWLKEKTEIHKKKTNKKLQLSLKLTLAMRDDFILGQHNLTDHGRSRYLKDKLRHWHCNSSYVLYI